MRKCGQNVGRTEFFRFFFGATRPAVPYRREFRWFGLLLKVIDTVTLSIIKFSILILPQIVENRESRQTGQIAGPRLPAVLYEDLFSS